MFIIQKPLRAWFCSEAVFVFCSRGKRLSAEGVMAEKAMYNGNFEKNKRGNNRNSCIWWLLCTQKIPAGRAMREFF